MKSEQIKQITNKAIGQLIAALNEGPKRNVDAIPCGNWPIPPL